MDGENTGSKPYENSMDLRGPPLFLISHPFRDINCNPENPKMSQSFKGDYQLLCEKSHCFEVSPPNIWGVSKNNGTPKSSILIGFSIINHPFWGTAIFGNIHIYIIYKYITKQ